MLRRIDISLIEWCREVVESNNYIVLDTETTGLYGEIIDLGICDIQGNILYDGLLKPACAIEPGAEAVHHISEAMVTNAPCFHDEWPEIWRRIAGKSIIAYNASFDSKRLKHTAMAHNVQLQEYDFYCAMLEYSDFYSEPSRYGSRRYMSYKWQKLENALAQQNINLGEQAHRALWDAQATAALIRKIAEMGEKSALWQEDQTFKFEAAPECWRGLNAERMSQSLE